MPSFPLSSLPGGSDVYVDANIFVYAMLAKSEQCRRLLKRFEVDLFGYSDARVLHDVSHRLMLAEATQSSRKQQNVQELNPSLVKSLTRWSHQVAILRQLPIEWFELGLADVGRVPGVATSTGLLCGDSLHLAIMQAYGISMIVSNDEDFVSAGLTVYRPDDI
jgi:predicted nucleic acid-binding protein